jgi:hypothetical protein
MLIIQRLFFSQVFLASFISVQHTPQTLQTTRGCLTKMGSGHAFESNDQKNHFFMGVGVKWKLMSAGV